MQDTLTIQQGLENVMALDGAIGGAIVDYESGMTLGTTGGRQIDMELAGAGNTEVLRSEKNVLADLGLNEHIQDILITLENQYHLIRMCERHENIFIYVIIDRDQGNLGLARRKVDQIDEVLELE
jgi:hypothetical protein